MAEEERGGAQNVWLLFIALGLGLVVVVIYNVHIYKVRREGRGKAIHLLRVTRDIDAGDKLASDDLEKRLVPRQYEQSLGNVVGADTLDFAIGQALNRPIEKGQWLLWEHITGGDTRKPAWQIGQGNVAVGVPLDTKTVPGDILRQNDRVNIVGLIPIGSTLKTFRIIEGVRVLAIGGEGIKVPKSIDDSPKVGGVSRSYHSITVEVSQDVSLKFTNILTHVSGRCWVELLSSREEPNPKKFGRINPLLEKIAAEPSRPVRGETDWE
jgi:Flp pilus assembly protein CpaB